ncbi:MAG TPA: rod shape-determining protein RodA [Terriglobia bacterium]|nr:rod shape-determining protein RodA [Terriglobia bacterium]
MVLQLHVTRDQRKMTIAQKLREVTWSMVLLICVVASIGFAVLYSAAHGSADPWMDRQMMRFGVGLVLMLAVAMVDLRQLMKIAYPLYAFSFVLLIYVDVAGHTGMGATRWIDLKFIQLQPSELMKIALVLSLARYFNAKTYEDIGRPHYLIIPVLMAVLPTGLVLKQPDLGTAGMLMMVAGAMFFAAGVRWWKFALVIAIAVAGGYYAWHAPNLLHDYQRNRILTFLDPDQDALGTGYHITQSKIALGSGGLFGKGFMQGSQSHLDFLPEHQTDFIFTTFAEEFGMVGGVVLLGLYSLLVLYGVVIALRSRSHFGRLMAFGLAANLFLYFFINTAMVMGLIPVVGVPLPLISYGGTAMITVMIGFGLIISVYIHRDMRLGRRSDED